MLGYTLVCSEDCSSPGSDVVQLCEDCSWREWQWHKPWRCAHLTDSSHKGHHLVLPLSTRRPTGTHRSHPLIKVPAEYLSELCTQPLSSLIFQAGLPYICTWLHTLLILCCTEMLQKLTSRRWTSSLLTIHNHIWSICEVWADGLVLLYTLYPDSVTSIFVYICIIKDLQLNYYDSLLPYGIKKVLSYI